MSYRPQPRRTGERRPLDSAGSGMVTEWMSDKRDGGWRTRANPNASNPPKPGGMKPPRHPGYRRDLTTKRGR